MKLSKNISDSEANIACNCGCGFNKVSTALIDMIQDVRDHFNKPVFVNSCCRCSTHNKKVGGAKNSFHLPDINGVSRGADIRVKDIHADKVADYLEEEYPTSCGIGRYRGRTHLDDRAKRARWDKR